ENKNNLEDEIIYRLVSNILDAIEEKVEDEEEFKIIYYKDQISIEQYQRIYEITKFILENIFPFDNFEEVVEDNNSILRTSDDVGIFHTCFFEIVFSETEHYEITPRTCECGEIYSWLNLMLPSLLSLDLVKIWISIKSSNLSYREYDDRIKSLIKMYVGTNYIESWTHIGYLAEILTRKIYLDTYQEETEKKVKAENWNRLLKRLTSEKDSPLLQHLACLLDSIRPLRNEILHHGYLPTSEDVEFGIMCITRVIDLYATKTSNQSKSGKRSIMKKGGIP
ncbi:MAG: hypothetical protein ACFFDS_08175, partial [Candidatus Thorarchaeota archaeon]